MVALVTGASRGIGKAIALELASLGYDIALVGRELETLEAAARDLETRALESGFEICTACIPAELADPDAPASLVSRAVSCLGGIDVLVNCAGLSLTGSFAEVSVAEWDRLFAVNARAPFFICKEALPYLKKSARPTVINIASVVGFKGYENQSVYAS